MKTGGELAKIYRFLCIATLVVTIISSILSILVYVMRGIELYKYYAIIWFILFLITLYFYKSGVDVGRK